MLNFVAEKILQAFESQHDSLHYLEEKRSELEWRDKFQSLLYLNLCDMKIREAVADSLGVSIEELQTTIKTLQHC